MSDNSYNEFQRVAKRAKKCREYENVARSGGGAKERARRARQQGNIVASIPDEVRRAPLPDDALGEAPAD